VRLVKSIKFRLTVWYLVVLLILLLVFSTAAYFLLSHNLYQNLDDSLELRAAQLESALSTRDGDISLEDVSQWDFQEELGELVLLYDAEGNLLHSWGPGLEIEEEVDRLLAQAIAGRSSVVTADTVRDHEVRLYGTPLGGEVGTNAVLVVGRSTHEIGEVLGTFRSVLFIAVPMTVLLAAGGGLFLARRAFKPVDRITQTARGIEESDLSRRIEVNTGDELGRLASTLNQMIGRLEKAFRRQRQFTADASHELRTPLAVIEAESTLALRKQRTTSDYEKSLELISQEASYMSTILDKLLMLARADAGEEQLSLDMVNLRELLVDLASDVEILCREKGLDFQSGPLEDLIIEGDKVKLKQLFLNLFENAIRYTPVGGTVSVSLARKEKTAVTSITDTGIGIPQDHIPHIFERFYRVDKARSRGDRGTGLGLSISKHIAETHGGKIEVESQFESGSIFSVVLPLPERN
jgi:heavy metal sensor kinase